MFLVKESVKYFKVIRLIGHIAMLKPVYCWFYIVFVLYFFVKLCFKPFGHNYHGN